MPNPANYHRSQLIAHWMVVILVLMQFLFNDGMVRAFETAVEEGSLPPSGAMLTHGFFGSLILGLMLWRVSLRWRYGAPPPSEAEPTPVQRLSRGNHYAFYVLLIAMPLAGYTPLLTLMPVFGRIHSLLSWLLLFSIVLHLSGVLAHVFYFRTKVHKRMLQQDSASSRWHSSV